MLFTPTAILALLFTGLMKTAQLANGIYWRILPVLFTEIQQTWPKAFL